MANFRAVIQGQRGEASRLGSKASGIKAVVMRIFNLNNEYNIVCNWQNTRYGFRHLASLHRNGFEIAKAKTCYYNRTWERFEYETTLIKIIEDNFEGNERAEFLRVISELR